MVSNQPLQIRPDAGAVAPSPRGEGWGEGKGGVPGPRASLQTTHVQSYRVALLSRPALNPPRTHAIPRGMADAPAIQERYDDAMFDFSQANYEACIEKLTALLAEAPTHFDAQLALGMAYYRKGDYP